MKVKEMLDNFKGHVISEQIRNDLFSNEELTSIIGEVDIDALKTNWVKNFIEIGAFKILLSCLANLNQKNS